MKPDQVLRGIFYGFCLIAVLFSWMASGTYETQNRKLTKVIVEQQEEIKNLEFALVYAHALNGMTTALEYIMPEVCISELSRISYKVRKMKEEG